MIATKERWLALMYRLSIGDNIDTYDELVEAYSHSDRHYHNLDHISDMLELLDKHMGKIERPSLMELAIWFHDGIYEIPSYFNEYQSSMWALRFMRNNGMGLDKGILVHEMIMATTHKIPCESNDSKIIADIDLSPLGASWEVFTENAWNIRKEYIKVPDSIFNPAREELHIDFLNWENLYYTDIFRLNYEHNARVNLRKMLNKANGHG